MKCVVDWCNCKQNASGRGYCRKHYDQLRKHGHVLPERIGYAPSEIEVHDDYAEIIIADKYGKELERAMIDKEDISKVEGKRWTDNGNGYIRTFSKTRPVYLHRLIMGYDSELDIDHIDRNKLNNRKENLRIVTRLANANNRESARPFFIKNRKLSKPYCASQTIMGVYKHIGYFATEKEAEEALKADRMQRL